jgi:hypothetical protein
MKKKWNLPCASECVEAVRLKSDFALDKGFMGLVASLMERISRHEASIDFVFLSCDAIERRSSSTLGLLGDE